MDKIQNIRNIAIIAHVDHGKTTLVDELLKQSGTFRKNQNIQERVMDSNDLEKERGITILSKNTAVNYKDMKINIVDTPGHADFGGEVERVLKMVDGVILVVDAFEGTMPQTKFVLKKALDLDLSLIVCINKIDRSDARVNEVEDEVLELLMELEADESQFESPFIYASAKQGIATLDVDTPGENMEPLFDTIIKYIPMPDGNKDDHAKMLVTTIDYNDYLGQIAIGKIHSGAIKVNDEVSLVNANDDTTLTNAKVVKLYTFEGLDKKEVSEASCGSIIGICLSKKINVGDTITSPEDLTPIQVSKISPPTVMMTFSANDSPFAGKEGEFVTSRHLHDRLFKELNTDVSLRVEVSENNDSFKVYGRGELHLSILIENLRREGYELQVSKPEVIIKEIDGVKCEPIEDVTIDIPEEFSGTIIEKLSKRKGELTHIGPFGVGYSRLKFKIPARGLIGYRGEFLTDTKGSGVINSVFDSFAPYKGEIVTRLQGSLIAFEKGQSTSYGLGNAQTRGSLYIGPGVDVYEGMVVGKNSRIQDMEVNVCKKKQLTNVRASGTDDAIKLIAPIILSLEQSLEYIHDDELLEVTPKSLRIRKKILDQNLRAKSKKKI